MNDGFGVLIALCVAIGLIHGYLKTHSKKPLVSDNSKPTCADYEEFDSDDVDRDVDEMPDDSLIYDIFN
jgi:hypothetical protein